MFKKWLTRFTVFFSAIGVHEDFRDGEKERRVAGLKMNGNLFEENRKWL